MLRRIEQLAPRVWARVHLSKDGVHVRKCGETDYGEAFVRECAQPVFEDEGGSHYRVLNVDELLFDAVGHIETGFVPQWRGMCEACGPQRYEYASLNATRGEAHTECLWLTPLLYERSGLI